MNKPSRMLGTSAKTLALVLTDFSQETPSTSVGILLSTRSVGDEMFMTMMIPDNQQVIYVLESVLSKNGLDPRLADLAQQIQQIQDDQEPDIQRTLGWPEAWVAEYDPDAIGGKDQDSIYHGEGGSRS